MKPSESTAEQNSLGHISWPIVYSGGLLGLFLSLFVLSGDDLGRVNLLYLLVLFLVIPIASVIISTLSMISGKGVNLARLVISLPLLSSRQKQTIHRLHQQKLDKYWLYMQSQYAAIAYALGSFFGYLFLLLFTDINFVWRSSVLAPDDLLQPLSVIATPWWFWSAAQPSLELLQATQDSRLVATAQHAGIYTQWWPFILATLVFYSLLLRLIGLAIGRVILKRKQKADIEYDLLQKIDAYHPGFTESHKHADPVSELPGSYVVTNWANFDQHKIEQLSDHLSISDVMVAGPLASEQQQSDAENEKRPQVLLVKAWEPPLAELGDFMQNTSGVLLPVNIISNKVTRPTQHHLDEWLRFAETFDRWQVYLPKTIYGALDKNNMDEAIDEAGAS